MNSARIFDIKSAVAFKKLLPKLRNQQTGAIKVGEFYRREYLPN